MTVSYKEVVAEAKTLVDADLGKAIDNVNYDEAEYVKLGMEEATDYVDKFIKFSKDNGLDEEFVDTIQGEIKDGTGDILGIAYNTDVADHVYIYEISRIENFSMPKSLYVAKV